MTGTFPAQNVAYLGPITDSSRWQKFRHRDDDIFICTPPKCGTTWTQAICAMLVFGTAEHGKQPGAVSPWIDANFAPIEDYLLKVEAQPHRRFLKTHTPLDGIPYQPSCTYLVVLRDPKDAYFSGLNHRDNMNDSELAHTSFPTGSNAYQNWLTGTREAGRWDVPALDSITHFFESYRAYEHLPNIHLYHYSDMKRDLRAAIASMAAAVGIEITDAQLDAYTQAATFENMKRNATQFAPESGTGMWKAETQFFASGVNGQWQDRLSAEELNAFDARLAALLPPEQASWLCNGTQTV